MLGRTNTGGGGGGLNFRVVGGTAEPANPKENTIWVNTDKINNYYFSATQPENMVDYDAWFYTAAASPVAFNALKRKNGIQICPISAKQYVSGKLVEVTAKSFQGGKWVDWMLVIFSHGTFGVEYRPSTNYSDFYLHSSLGIGNGTASVVGKEMVFGDNSPNYGCGGYVFTGVNLSGAKTLKITRTKQTSAYSTAHQNDICVFAVHINGSVVFTDNFRSFDVPETANIDVGSYGDNCTVTIASSSGGNAGNTIITHVSSITAE